MRLVASGAKLPSYGTREVLLQEAATPSATRALARPRANSRRQQRSALSQARRAFGFLRNESPSKCQQLRAKGARPVAAGAQAAAGRGRGGGAGSI
jgi:hypothetical protein